MRSSKGEAARPDASGTRGPPGARRVTENVTPGRITHATRTRSASVPSEAATPAGGRTAPRVPTSHASGSATVCTPPEPSSRPTQYRYVWSVAAVASSAAVASAVVVSTAVRPAAVWGAPSGPRKTT